MKKLSSLLIMTVFLFWGASGFSAVKFDYSLDVEQNWSMLGHFDLNDDGNNSIATRGDTGPAVGGATSNATGNASTDTVRWFDTKLAFNGDASVKGWGGNNVNFHMRLVSQFDWLGAQTGFDSNARPGSAGIVGTPYNSAGANAFALSLNQAYVKFEEFLNFPIDITMGRQNLWFGNGFIVGSRILGHGPTLYAGGLAPSGSVSKTGSGATGRNGQSNAGNAGNLPIGTSSGGFFHAPQYADYTGFDAVRADFEWKQFYMNAGWALVAGALTQSASGHPTAQVRDAASNNEEDFYFANLGVNSKRRAKYPWNLEAFWITNIDREPFTDRTAAGAFSDVSDDKIHTTGLRYNMDFPKLWGLKHLGAYVEGAFQFGELGAALPEAFKGRDREAWATNAGVDLRFKGKYKPWTSLEFAMFSGPDAGSIEDDDGIAEVSSDTNWTAWDPVFRGKTFSLIMDNLDVFFLTDQLAPDPNGAFGSVNDGRVDSAVTNRWLASAQVGWTPWKRLDWNVKVIYAQLESSASPGSGRDKELGTEVDTHFSYKVSNQIRWTIDGGVFFPGDYYNIPATNNEDRGLDEAWIVRSGFTFKI